MIRRLLVTFVLFLLIVASGFFSSLYLKRALDAYFNRRTVLVPDFVGKSLSEAIRIQKSHEGNLKIDISNEVESPSLPKDTVVTQEPPAGSLVNFEKTIFLTISKGTRLTEVPECLGLDLRRARLLLSEARMKVGKKAFVHSPDRERGIVMHQYPEGKGQAGQGEAVDLVVSEGRIDQEIMPRVTYLTLAEAKEVLKQAQITQVGVEEVTSTSHPAGLVLSQDPLPGTVIRSGASCRLTVCKGTGLVTDSRRRVWVQFEMPPGLTEKVLEVEVTDNVTSSKVHSQLHDAGETGRLQVAGVGAILVKFYLDQNPVPVLEQRY
ncbi:MAG: PASTA domain-containing protein [Candidatus Riflebacteria bacterium]|nr:PASTA domain-containing protein [Candidatus Riflebacteria bacterium]